MREFILAIGIVLLALPLVSVARDLPTVGEPPAPVQSRVLGNSIQCPNLSRNLSFGSRGQDVVELQNFLISNGDLAAGLNTGYFGSLTRAAVRKFQCREMGICTGNESTTGYGRVGAVTRAKIAHVCSGGGGGNVSANFTATPTSGSVPLTVGFTFGIRILGPHVTDGHAHKIVFGDGQQEQLRCSPEMYIEWENQRTGGGVIVSLPSDCAPMPVSHTYTTSGIYTARLVQFGGFCAASCPETILGTATINVSGSASSALFTRLPQGYALTAEQSQRFQAEQQFAITGSATLIAVKPSALQGGNVSVFLSDTLSVAVKETRRDTRSSSDFTWYGDVQSDTNSDIDAILVVRDGEITGTITAGLDRWVVSPIGNGIHSIHKVDWSKLPND